MAIGTHKYKVRGVAGDSYSMSNEVTVTLSVDAPEIAALGEMQWLRLEYSTAQNSPLGVSAYQDVAYQFYAGRRYPVAETSQQITKYTVLTLPLTMRRRRRLLRDCWA